MIDEHQQELAALYALDMLDDAQIVAFENELRKSEELQELVREFRESSATIALTAPQVGPSVELKSRIMEKIGKARSAPMPEAVTHFRFAVLVPWAIAASLAIGCLWLGQIHVRMRADYTILEELQALAEIETSSARNQLEAERILTNRQLADGTRELELLNQQVVQSTQKLAEATSVIAETYQQLDNAKAELTTRQGQIVELSDRLAAASTQLAELRERIRVEGDLAQFKIATLASMAGNSPQALAVAVWNPKTQQGVLRVEKLPALASDKDYQLWLIDPAYPAPVDSGVFTVDPATGHAQISFKPSRPVNNAAKFAVSLERKGGVPQVEGPIILMGD